MNSGDQPHPTQVPTLTEVIELLSPAAVGDGGMSAASRSAAPAPGEPGSEPIVTRGLPISQQREPWSPLSTVVVPSAGSPAQAHLPLTHLPVLDAVVPEAQLAPPPPAIDEAQIVQRVLGDVQRQIDRMIDFRLKEAITPILMRHSEAMVRELREELARTMADVVARSVAQEVAKLRQR